ncbi:two-component system sensor histidine kinase KdpD [Azomonas agilis]|uniref:histidine kinase n=1 Tax=Azomonas agilis TaxID=116849 RepID=A0A562I1T0_9GAMM|nr:sensor histidine kinase KdpD [Azomonas agilis]TWH64613.1 two-component system sensor histidine kinase KdpD [Azomonas agilis]
MSDRLQADTLLADLPASGRGRLKVFLGAAPGVGKTYAMLQAAHQQYRQGVALRVGVVETHNRSETQSLVEGLPFQPLRYLEYRGLALPEMDLDALLKDPPELVLVDELAHSNVPGSRHAKRWQDVQELLVAGIDVYTTVNVQHLESLNDQVQDITGIRVRETVPDWVLQEAFEILLIDLPPRELLERLREGKVYVPEQAKAATEAFFTQINLTALRELAMQTAAARVDADLKQRYRLLGRETPRVQGRLLVGIAGDIQAESLVRHACRVAERRNLPWSVVHVDTGYQRTESYLGHLQGAQHLAERLGGEIVTLRSGDASRTLLDHAYERQASLLLIGQSVRKRFRFKRTLGEQLLEHSHGLEISVLDARRKQRTQDYPRSAFRGVLHPQGYVWALVATLMAAGVAEVLYKLLDLPNISLVFLMAVLSVAVRSSLGPALFCSLLSFIAYNFLFIEPVLTLHAARHQDVLTLIFFLIMAGLTGNLASRQQQQLRALRQTQAETAALLELSRKLTAATDRKAVLEVAVQQLSRWPEMKISFIARNAEGIWRVEAGSQRLLNEPERAAADWAWQHDQAAGLGTDTLSSSRWWWYPLCGEQGPLILLGVSPDEGAALTLERKRLILALTHAIAQALERAYLTQALEQAHLSAETDQLRTALLASVSHDLKTPLTALRGSIDSLLVLGEQIPPEDRRALLESTRDEASRLERYIQNLLDMTRLGSGELKLERDWVAPADIVAGALHRLRFVLEHFRVHLAIPDSLPLLYVHGALIEQVLVNVLENAARFSPPQGMLWLTLEADTQELRFSLTDQGPGIPEAEREKIFDMFYSVKRGDRGGQGTGLGLAICQGILGAHQGRISVTEGVEGVGTTMIIHLPLHPQPEPDAVDSLI